ncbi:bifunctional diaminohydroxyphosphoribosylaminopyrimidine deaminase/5-amino-6-(5-phosphoribosylamino)uracil reductase RibD [Inediibacterium massiliense]|uniref:bifunctional diaminohydroxyphosphoribosylaminopyrimidine deaminase/5-amino-6-(5-phosphoribosylamino)uracil reductase RibD n=1 Tax=Inediibacterium massiliense TaxID=1658111 RepID=UPI0006B52125|nr:bifunctional diaminohydroxyphosphoribosylaminopyrimidine deaminase/5-amino-6-(5-phosphoribosylamino)uracil reductase RibD [Inediibacterium massiliense]
MDTFYMKKALHLAQKGIGHTSPNPLVGAVIVKNGQIIGEGYHEKFGGPHAEINAFLNSTEDVSESTMYVTLEPCSHYGKTPPCAQAIVNKKIKKVVIAMKDPNPLVSGQGIEILKKHNIEVVTGVLEEEAKKLNEIFVKYISTKLPFCILKTAMTLDGKIATSTKDSKWITNSSSREYVHLLRHKVTGIMVGIGTVLADDPLLTTRIVNYKGKNPIRIIVDSKGQIPLNSNILKTSKDIKTIIVTTKMISTEKIKSIENTKAEVLITPSKDGKIDLSYLMKTLGEKGIDSILLEGGGTLNFSALKEGIIDQVISFIAPKIIGGKDALTPIEGEGFSFMKDAICLNHIEVDHFKEDIMIKGYIAKER